MAALSPGTNLGSFEILGLLGAGGMGEVYRARDLKLDREVAVKVLPQSVEEDADRLARFEREAKTLASLDHPNVAAVYDFQEANGHHLLVMQLVPGQTLAERLARGAMPILEALEVFIDIARGLEAAHERGIIHRDLKPANIKIDQRGRPKILDFGLAKAVVTEPERDAASTLNMSEDAAGKTHKGEVLGTPAYMSPEQARGQTVDERADIWSFGACLYESLSGHRPFRGKTPQDLLADILREEPDWSALPSVSPAHLVSLLRRCLNKAVHRRFSSIGDIAISLEDIAEDWKKSFSRSDERRVPVISQADPAGKFAAGPPTPTPTPMIAKRIDRLVVLPFDNLMGDEGQAHFVYGMSEALSTELSKMTGVEVISHNSSMHYAGSNKPPRQIAEELGVDGLLGGAVMRAEDDIRITVRLIDGKSDRQLWADQYHGKYAKILSLQSQVALDVAEQVSTTLTAEDRLKSLNAPEVDPAAHEACLLGIHHRHRATAESLLLSLQQFRRSISIAPSYAPAYAGLANTIIVMTTYGGFPPREGYMEAQANARKATELDPELGEAFAVLAVSSLSLEHDWSEADRLFNKAIELSPDDPIAHSYRATYLAFMGRHDEAENCSASACRLDPLTSFHWNMRGLVAMYRRDYEAALAHLDRVAELETGNPLELQTRVQCLVLLHRYDAAIESGERLLDLAPNNITGMRFAAIAYAYGSRMEEARRLLTRLQEDHAENLKGTLGTVYLALKEYEHALDELEVALDTADLSAVASAYGPIWDPVRTHPRFRAMRKKLGLTEDDDLVGSSSPSDWSPDSPSVSQAEPSTDSQYGTRVVATEARQACLLGRHYTARGSRDALKLAREQYEKAISIDADYAIAYAGLAETFVFAALMAGMRQSQAFAEAQRCATRATELDGSLAGAYAIQAFSRIFIDQDWKKAEELLAKALDLNPNDPDVLFFAGLLNVFQGRNEEAVRCLEASTKLDPLHALRWAIFAGIQFFGRDFGGAMRTADQALSIDPNATLAIFSQLWVLIVTERFEEATEACDRMMQFHPNEPSALYNAALVYGCTGREDEARAIAEMTPHPSAHKGWIYLYMGEHEEALNQLESSFGEIDWAMMGCGYNPLWDPIRAHPRFREIRRRLGFDRDDDIDPSEITADVAEVNPEAKEAYVFGKHYLARGSLEALGLARKQFRKAISVDSKYAPAYAALAETYIHMAFMGGARPIRSIAQARRYAEQATELDTSSAGALAALAFTILCIDPDSKDGRRLLIKSRNLDSEDPDGQYFLGVIHIFRGRNDQAIQCLRTSTKLDPLNGWRWAYLALAYYFARDFDTAMQNVQQALRIDPTNTFALLNKTWILVASKRFDEALSAADDMLRYYPNEASVLYNAALAFASGGREDEARAIAKRSPHPSAAKALSFLYLGEHETALDQLEKSFDEIDGFAFSCGYAPLWDPVRSHPRFRALRRKMGFYKDDDLDLMNSDLPPK